MNLDDAIDQAIAAAITHFAMHQALKRQAVSHETLDQYITDGLQKIQPGQPVRVAAEKPVSDSTVSAARRDSLGRGSL